MNAKLAYEFFEKAFYSVMEQKIRLYPENRLGLNPINGFSVKEDDYVFTKTEKDLRVIIKETPEVDCYD